MHDADSSTEQPTSKQKAMTVAPVKKRSVSIGDLRGAARLGVDGVIAVTDLVEAVHGSVTMGFSAQNQNSEHAEALRRPPTRGITRLVYRSITGITNLSGTLLDKVLALVDFDPTPTTVASRKRESVLAVVNGVIGDHLHDSDNPLAIRSSLRQHGRSLNIDDAAQLSADLATAAVPSSKIMLFIHGLCMHDQHWTPGRTDATTESAPAPAEQLAARLGHTAVYLHYNSGRHISSNGRELAERLDTLVSHWPVPVTEVCIIGHSMGGLIARSACHYAQLEQQDWLQHLQQMVFLGTPHHGAPLERIGHQIDRLLQASRFSRPFARIGQVRSAGITDLRYGNVVDEDWLQHHRFAESRDTRAPVPLPDAVKCYAVAGSSAGSFAARDELPGDGLVPVASALGQHADPTMQLALSPQQQSVIPGCGHLQLLQEALVWQQLEEWLSA